MADDRLPLIVSEPPSRDQESVVLLSGGLDSAVLVAHEARTHIVHPVYVSAGLAWEASELEAIRALLGAPVFAERVRPIATLDFSMRDVYPPSHWALRGTPPARDTPDEAVYLQGRNVALLAKTSIYGVARNIQRLVIGPLAGNPFPDATPQFFAALARALSLGLGAAVEIAAPFAALRKSDVIKLGIELQVPLDLTLSCMNPAGRRHCGRCSKCRERHDAFLEAAVTDPTDYASPSPH
jgi:7-cyano-7-deazaguanine synthase